LITGLIRARSSSRAEGPRAVTVHFVDPGASWRRLSVQARVGQTVVDVAKQHGVDIHAACGQQLQCATCHVIMHKAFYDRLPEPGVRENDMLETAYTLTDTSRLGCQVRLTPAMDGAEFVLPSKAAKGLVRMTAEQPRPKVTTAWSSTPAIAPSMASVSKRAPPRSAPMAQAGGPAAGIAQEWERLYHEQRNRSAILEQQLLELRAKSGAGGDSRASKPLKASQAVTNSGVSVADGDEKDEHEQLKAELANTIVKFRGRSRWPAFGDIVGMEDAKRVLRESVLWPALGPPELFRGIRGKCRGVLLYGPPGCGKTMLAKAAAAELCGVDADEAGATFFHVRPSDVMSKFYGDSQKRIAALEALTRERSPAIVFFDEVDTLLGKRDGGAGVAEHHKGVINALLTWMDGFDRGEERVFFVGATNRADAIDEAALRRFGDLVEVGLPTEEQRRDLLENLVVSAARDGHRAELAEQDFAKLARGTEGMSGDDVARLAQQAFLEVLRELPGGVHRGLALEMVPPVTMAHFESALQSRVRPARDVYRSLQRRP